MAHRHLPLARLRTACRALVLGLLLAGAGAPLRAADTVVINVITGPVGAMAAAVLREAYGRIGVTMHTRVLPGERALQEANLGVTDGDLMRIEGIEARYPNLVRVPVVLQTIEAMVYTRGLRIELKGWDSLRPYRIGIERGIKFAEQGTQGMRVEVAPNHTLLFKKLAAGRTELVVSTRVEGEIEMRLLHDAAIVELEPPLTTVPLYHYVNRKNRALVPGLAAALRAMEREGRIRAIGQQVLRQWHERADGAAPH